MITDALPPTVPVIGLVLGGVIAGVALGLAGARRWLTTPPAAPEAVTGAAGETPADVPPQAAARADGEALWRRAIDTEPEGVCLFDAAGVVRRMNSAAVTMIEAATRAAVGLPFSTLLDEDGRSEFTALVARVMNGASDDCELLVTGLRGRGRWVALSAAPLRDEHGSVAAVLAVLRDVSERKRTDALLRWEKRALELVVRSQSLSEVLDSLMRGLEEQAPGALCSVMLLDETRTNLRVGAGPSLPKDYVEAIRSVTVGPRTGSCGTAAYFNRQVIVRDIQVDPLWVDYRDLADRFGLRACWSTPIRSEDGGAIGTFAIYYREPRLPEAVELELIERAQSLVALAVLRKQAEAALVESRERQDLALHAGELGVWEWHPRSNRTTHSKSWARLLGYEPSEIGSTLDWFATHLHPDDAPLVLQRLSDYLDGRAARYESQHRMRKKSGAWIWVYDRGQIVRADAEGPLLVAGVVSDVTPLKDAEAALLESQQRYEIAVLGSSDGIWDWDMKSNATYFSPRWKAMLGYDDHEIANDYAAWNDLLHPEDRERTMQALTGYIAGSLPAYASEFRMRRKDGGHTWILARGAALRDATGRPVRMAGSHTDITARKESERALQASQRMIETIINAIPVRVFWKDRDLNYIGCNHAFARDSAFASPEDLIGRDDYQMGWRDQAELYRADDRAVIESGRPKLDIEEPLTMPDGQVVTLLTSKVPLRNEAGEVVGVLGTYLDISERTRAEEEVRRLNRDLEATVRTRTAELQQREEQLRDIFDGTSDLIQSVDAEGRLQLTNRAWRETLGYTATDLEGLGLLDVIHPDARAHYTEFHRRLVAGETPGVLETVMVAKDGRLRHVEGSVSIKRHDGTPAAMRAILRDVTARKAADRALRESEETHRLMIRSSGDAILTLAPPDWRFTSGNPAALELFGAPSEESMRAMRLGDASPVFQPGGQSSIEASLAHIETALATGSTSFEWQHQRFDGSSFMASVSLSRIEQNGSAYVLGTVRDITVQKHAEAAQRALNERLDQLVAEKAGQLRESEERFRQLVEASPNTVLMTAPDGRISFANRRAEAMFGYRPDELIGQSVEMLVPQARRASHARLRGQHGEGAHARMMGDGTSFAALRKDGSEALVEIGLTSVVTPAGPFTMATIADVTARREAEAALRASEVRKAAIFESTLDALVTFDSTGRIVEWNRAAERMFGHPAAVAIGREMAELIVPAELRDEHRAHVAQLSTETAAQLLRQRFSYTAVRAEGSAFPVEIYVAPTGGDPVLYTAFIRDVTERLALETQLRQAQRLEAIGQLAGGVAHDFNNILMVVMMQAEASALTEGVPAEALESLEEIRASAERGTELTKQLLLFSRRQVMQTRDVDLNDVVTALTKMLQRIIGEDITLELHLHAARLALRADVGMLDQVLLNLAVNARDAMPGGGRLRIETWERDVMRESPDTRAHGTGRFVGLTVSDTGIGIAPDVLPRIFEPFFTTKEAGKGTGLGLATVFGIVEQHHGWLDVSSDIGLGTRVDIYLPAAEVARVLPASSAAALPVPGGTETVLVVEDEETVRMVITKRLARGGYTVLSASSGVEALEIWRAERDRIDLLLTDLVMPNGIRGQELGKRLRAEKPGLGVVYCSGYSPEFAGREVQLEPGETFLQKPFPAVTLLSVVRQTLDRTRAAA